MSLKIANKNKNNKANHKKMKANEQTREEGQDEGVRRQEAESFSLSSEVFQPCKP